MAYAVALGELLIDFASVSAGEPGAEIFKANPGGAPGNFLAALSAYGVVSSFIGKVGDDAFGELILSALRRAGVGTEGVVRDGKVFTTLAFVSFSEGGERSFSFARKPGADTMLRETEIDFSLIDRADLFHFGTLSLTDEPAAGATRAAVGYAREKGKLVSFDPNYRPPLWRSEDAARRAMLFGIGHADVVKMSEDEAEFLWGISPQEAAERLVFEYGVGLAMLTLGAEGSILRSRSGSARIAPIAVSAVDTTGAGDIYGGAAMSRLLALGKAPAELRDSELIEIGRFASVAAGLSTQSLGGMTSVPLLDEVLRRVKEL